MNWGWSWFMIHGRKLWTKQEVILTMASPSSAGMTIMDVWRSKGLRPSLALRLSSLLIFRHWNPQLIGGICQYIYIYTYILIYIYTYLHNYILIIYKEMHSTQLGSLEQKKCCFHVDLWVPFWLGWIIIFLAPAERIGEQSHSGSTLFHFGQVSFALIWIEHA